MANLETYFASVPPKNRYKLDHKLDFEHDGVQMNLGIIANSMDEWEGNIAEQIQLTRPEIEDIKRKFPGKLSLQTRAALQKWQEKLGLFATYRALITAFVRAGRGDYAEAVCKVLGESGCLESSYLASLPQSKRYKLDKKLDFNHGGDPIDLNTIASSMDEWEGNIAEQLQLTRPEIEDIKMEFPGKLSLQTRAALLRWQEKFGFLATYQALITAFVQAGRGDVAETVCKVLGQSASNVSPPISRHKRSEEEMTPPTFSKMQLEVQHDYKPGIWHQGILVAANNDELTNSPMKLLKRVTKVDTHSGEGFYAISLCKQHLLGTYQFHNEYSSPSPDIGCELNAVNQSKCKFPAVVVVSVSDTQQVPDQLEQADLNVDVIAGLPERVSPDVLFASQYFLENYGFNKKEVIWYRHITPLPLDRVMLSACDGHKATEQLMLTCPGKVVGQIYEKSHNECVTVQQDFNFAMKVTLPHALAESLPHFASTPIVECDDESSPLSPTDAYCKGEVNFKILECSPVLQGKITEQTTIAFLPPNEEEEEEEHFYEMNEEVELRLIETSGESLHADDSVLTFRGRSESNASASDFRNEDIKDEIEAIKLVSSRDNKYIIEAVPISEFKLQSHCVVLPKQSAAPHGIYGCQQVWVSSTIKEIPGSPRKRRSPLRDLIVPLVNLEIKERYTEGTEKEPKHLAMVFLYEDEFQLEKHVPLPSLEKEYSSEDLTRAYIHPELLFYLYPETLSPSRRYFLQIERVKEDIPPLTKLWLSEVYHPGTQMEAGEKAVSNQSTTKPLRSFFSYRTMYIHKRGVFSIKVDDGKSVFYKVHSFEPDTSVAVIDTAGAWELSVKPKVKSYLPDIVPPSPHRWEPVPYFEDIQPPGLEEYCDTLFSLFVPVLRGKSSTQPRRSPSVLLYGPPGVGKRTVIKAVAKRCRMHVVEVNCFEFCSEVVGFAEKKMTVDLDSASINSPVVIVLRQVHMMGKRSPIKEEPRYMAVFEHYMNEMNKFNRTSQFPVLVVGMTSELNSVAARIQACFLHQLKMTPPTETQRQAMLSALSLEYSLAPEIDLVQVAKQTAGFVMGDYVTLFTNAFDKAFEDATKYSVVSLGHVCPEDLAVSGIVLTESHVEKALGDLHASHSDAIGAPKIPNVKWDDVGGLAEAKREILDTIQLPLIHPELFPPGLRRSGVLLYGAPGTGKTLLAKAVATECSMNFLSVKGPELINMYVGQSEENIREVFTRARSAAPCIVFFDELDSIAPNRGRSGDSGGVMDRVVSQLLAELDGLQKSENVFVIGATNRPDLIDPGLLRPGRFDRLVYLDVSADMESKVKILRAITRKFNKSDDVDLTVLAEKCPLHLTGADLYALCSDAMLTALRKKITELELEDKSDEEWEGQLMVYQQDFLDSLDTLTPSVTEEELKRYADIRKTMVT